MDLAGDADLDGELGEDLLEVGLGLGLVGELDVDVLEGEVGDVLGCDGGEDLEEVAPERA